MFWQIATTITFSEILPSVKAIASFKVPDYNSGKVDIWAVGCLFQILKWIIMAYTIYSLFTVGGSVFP